jgi:cathepsin X
MPDAPVGVSAQMILNCKIGGDCNGGDPAPIFEYAHLNGLPDTSCLQFTASNLDTPHETCEDMDICRDCSPPSPPLGESWFENCTARKNFKRYYISDYYTVVGAD